MNRPTIVTVFAVIDVTLGLTLMVIVAIALWPFVTGDFVRSFEGLSAEHIATATIYTIVFHLIDLVVVLLSIVCGIGLILMKRWGRTAAYILAAINVLSFVIGVALWWLLLRDAVSEIAADDPRRQKFIGGFVGSVFCCSVPFPLYYIVQAVVLSRPGIGALFGREN